MDWTTPALPVSKYAPLFATVCFVATALWTGTLFAVSWVCDRARMMADAEEIGRLCVSLFRRWTLPSLFISVAAGAAWCTGEIEAHGPGHWLYAATFAVFALVALSVAVGERARRIAARGFDLDGLKGQGMRRLALLLSIWATVAVTTLRSALVP